MLRCLIVVLSAIICLIVTPAAAERRVALVVGNAQYAYTQALVNPRNDAQDMAEALKKVGFEVTLGLDLDQTRFARIIDDFARALDGADVGLFFYAGHGVQINEKNYLVSTGAKLESAFLVPSETIELDAIIRLMESKTATNLVFLDACRNNPLTDNLKRNLAAINRAIAVGRGLARVEPTGRDTLIAFSSAPGQEAVDGKGRNSPFTASLLRHLMKPGLEVSVMLKEVTADVRGETNNAQRPQQLSDMSKTFYFVKAEPAAVPPSSPAGAGGVGGAPAPQAAPTEGADAIDVAFWQSAAAANECESIRAYLRRFANGKFVDLARIAERRLCGAGPAGPEIAALAPPSPTSVVPALTPGPAAAAAPTKAAPNVAVAAPSAPPPSAAPAVPPVAAPDLVDIGRKLQKELVRVGCAATSIESDGTWGTASRQALHWFNERTRSLGAVDQPTPETLEAVRGHKERVCPTQCEAGKKLRGTSCVAAPPAAERSRHAARPSESDRSLRVQRPVERPDAARPGSPSAAAGQISPSGRNGESWIYVGKQRCMTYEPRGSPPRIICP